MVNESKAVETIAIDLNDGPFAGHRSAYPLGWPPPERLVAVRVGGRVGVGVPRNGAALPVGAALYRKVSQSQLPAPHPHVLRGASYDAEAR